MGVKVAAVVVMLGSGVAAVQLVPAKAFERLSTTGSEITEGTMNKRLQIWQAGMHAVAGRPLHGYGPAGWYRVAGSRAPHNTYLSILVEEGLVGLLLFLTLLSVVLRGLLGLPRFERRVGLTLLATLATAMTPLGWDYNKASWMVLALLAGFSAVLAPGGVAQASARSLPSGHGQRLRNAPSVTVE
jgi:O-antigen ligase